MVNIVRKDMLEGIGPFNPLACISLQCGLKQINVIQNNCEKKLSIISSKALLGM